MMRVHFYFNTDYLLILYIVNCKIVNAYFVCIDMIRYVYWLSSLGLRKCISHRAFNKLMPICLLLPILNSIFSADAMMNK